MSDLYLYQTSASKYAITTDAVFVNFDHFEHDASNRVVELFRGNEFIGLVRRKHYEQFTAQMNELKKAVA